MIFSSPFKWFCKSLLFFVSGLNAPDITGSLDALVEIACFGVWVVGVEFLSLLLTTALFWITTKLTIGLLLWVWNLLPFT